MRTTGKLAATTALVTALLGAAASSAWAASGDDPTDPPADPVAVLTLGAPGGPAAGVGDVINAALLPGTEATFASSSGGTTGVHCTDSTFTASIVDNPAAPGTATESLTGQTFAACTANVLGVSGVTSITVDNLPYSTTVDSTGAVTVSGTATAPIQTTVKLRTLLGSVTCVYQAASISGGASNDDQSITFTNQQFAKTSGPGTCFANGFFTAKYSPINDTTASTEIYVN
jgi:hypothetical protein